MERTLSDLRIFVRATAILSELRMRHLAMRYGLRLFAGLIAIFGLVMLNLAGFWALDESLGHILAAVVVALGDLFIALALILLSSHELSGQSMALAEELHGAALDALLADAKLLEGAVRHPVDMLLPGLAVPLANLLMARLKGSRGETK